MKNFNFAEPDRSSIVACTFLRSFGYFPAIATAILEAMEGSFGKILDMNERERDDMLGPFSKFRGKLSDAEMEKSRRELRAVCTGPCSFVPLDSPLYPEILKDCPDAPAGLYIKSGSPIEELFHPAARVSIVGTRDISPYGVQWTRRIVQALGQAPIKPVIVSGLALGVDVHAHRAALESGLPTFAVLPTGIDSIYPRQHTDFAASIVSSPGSALITDFPAGTAPLAITFLRRNRIIAGLSGTTVLVESKKKGGGLITARTAFSYGREVFAVPGRLDDIRSEGCNSIIREKIAEPVGDLCRLASEIGLGSFNRRKTAGLEEEIRDRFSQAAEKDDLLKAALAIKAESSITYTGICQQTGLGFERVCILCGLLEAEGFISVDVLQRCSIIASYR